MGDDVTALLVAIARENADLRQQLAAVQDMLVETAIDAGNLDALVEALQTERDAWRDEAERSRPAGAHHNWEPSPYLVAIPAVRALCDDQNLFRSLGLKLILGSTPRGSA